jgi:hypothetical protein
MTTPPDPIIASARIIAPEDPVLDRSELALMKILLVVSRMAGVPVHAVRFDDGVLALVHGDPNDTEAWWKALAQIHEAAVEGHVGPLQIDEERRP